MTVVDAILDLDHTLVDSRESDEPKRIDIPHLEWQDMVIVPRPYVQEFLDELFKKFRVSVWTAAQKDYANFVVDKIVLAKPDRQLKLFLHAQHCGDGTKKSPQKDLHRLKKFQVSNAFIFDDSTEVLQTNPNATVGIKPFYAENYETDTELKSLAKELRAWR